MNIKDNRIDSGKAFDWGRVSNEYAKYRDIYPDSLYEKLANMNICVNNQKVLDIGTGTGVLPRNMYKFGANFTGTDISDNQIKLAKELSKNSNMNIEYKVSSAENLSYKENSFDIITAFQCFFYFKHDVVMPLLSKILKPNGKLIILYMAWLPNENHIAGNSENLILKYNPLWSGANEIRHPIILPDITKNYFSTVSSEVYDIDIPFTKESWIGRLKACRGIGASLTQEEINNWEKEERNLLDKTAPENFNIKHYIALTVLQNKKINNEGV